MPASEKVQRRLIEVLAEGETIEVAELMGVKVNRAAIAKAAAASAAVSIAGALLGGTAIGFAQLPSVWCVVTDQRVALFAKVTGYFKNPVGTMIFSAPRSEVRAEPPTGVLHTVIVRRTSDGEELLNLKAGVGGSRRSDAVAAALAAAPS